jgi:predicted nucleic acid-binding protein
VTYFDTNVLIYGLGFSKKNEDCINIASKVLDDCFKNGEITVYFLALAEMSFVLSKMKFSKTLIHDTIKSLIDFILDLNIDLTLLYEFVDSLKNSEGYIRSFDILHLILAKRLGCTKFVTFDRDFMKFRNEFKDIEIIILSKKLKTN